MGIFSPHYSLLSTLSPPASGAPTDEILRSYPALRAEDVQAAMAYAAELARERLFPLPTGAT